jgi:signal transduction histidine kinase
MVEGRTQELEQQAVLDERQRLARDLHDSVAQALYSVSLYAEAAARSFELGNADAAQNYLGEIKVAAQEALRDLRLLIFDLRPPMLEQEGLIAVIQSRLEAVEVRAGFDAQLIVSGTPSLSLATQEGLYRILQEALNNVLKHARASHVCVNLDFAPALTTLEVTDDGIGFDPKLAHEGRCGFGLRDVAERVRSLGGTLDIESAPGRGTHLRVVLITESGSGSGPG